MRAPLLVSLLLASAPALAQPAGFPALDRNGDGYTAGVNGARSVHNNITVK